MVAGGRVFGECGIELCREFTAHVELVRLTALLAARPVPRAEARAARRLPPIKCCAASGDCNRRDAVTCAQVGSSAAGLCQLHTKVRRRSF